MLPEELIDKIVQLTPPAELLALSLANSRMYAIAVPRIYNHVEVKRPQALISFCAALQGRLMLSELVQVLIIDFTRYTRKLKNPGRANPLYNRAVQAVCAAAIGTLQNMVIFTARHATYLLPLLPKFPNLESFSSNFSHEIGPFIRANQQIRVLRVGEALKPKQRRAQVLPVRLPYLERFVGPPVLGRAVLPFSYVDRATVLWDLNERKDRWLVLLRRVVPITKLDNVMFCYEEPNPFHIAIALPGLESVKFRIMVPRAAKEERQEFVELLTMSMSRYTRLKNLEFSHPRQPPPLTQDTFDFEWDLLQRWYSLCPTLRWCLMPSGTAWVYAGPGPLAGLWLPGNLEELSQEAVNLLQNQKDFVFLVGDRLLELDSAALRSQLQRKREDATIDASVPVLEPDPVIVLIKAPHYKYRPPFFCINLRLQLTLMSPPVLPKSSLTPYSAS
ncbi:hypothetical protein C8R43DRAFT_1139773 [Mycena crocata]|nr:hypothetical protein C8R43DRAFT_1139773 [Mycena crocata]